jgi:hypothetical protein
MFDLSICSANCILSPFDDLEEVGEDGRLDGDAGPDEDEGDNAWIS